jgi:hypothetical protein
MPVLDDWGDFQQRARGESTSSASVIGPFGAMVIGAFMSCCAARAPTCATRRQRRAGVQEWGAARYPLGHYVTIREFSQSILQAGRAMSPLFFEP